MTQRTANPQSRDLIPTEMISYEDYLQCAHEDDHTEWVNGIAIPMSPISRLHQGVGRFLLTMISYFVEAQQLGEVFYEPFQMKLGPNLPGRSPDILFVSQSHLERLHENYLDGPADFVVEIISPQSRARDRGEKFFEYEAGGVTEYWLIDPPRKKAEFYQLGPDGLYQPILPGPENRYHSSVLSGLWLQVNWLWQQPLPTLAFVLKAWDAA